MINNFAILFALFLTISTVLCSAHAQDATSANVFSDPGENTATPTYQGNSKGQKGRLKQFLGSEVAKIPTWEQIKMIPSLTGPQRKQLRTLYKSSRDEMKPLQEELKKMKEQVNSQAVSPEQGMEMRMKAKEIRNQIVNSRQKLWSSARNLLSSKQMEELEEMKQGTLMPPTFNQESPTAQNIKRRL